MARPAAFQVKVRQTRHDLGATRPPITNTTNTHKRHKHNPPGSRTKQRKQGEDLELLNNEEGGSNFYHVPDSVPSAA